MYSPTKQNKTKQKQKQTNKRIKKLKINYHMIPAIPLLGMHLKKTKTLIRKDTCTPMFIAALFILLHISRYGGNPSVHK